MSVLFLLGICTMAVFPRATAGWACNCTRDGPGCFINDTLVFDGVDGIPPPLASNLGPLPPITGGNITISAFVWTAEGSRTASWARVVDLGNGDPGDNILLTHSGRTGRMAYQVYVGSVQRPSPLIESVNLIPEGAWLHVVVVQSGDLATLYWSEITNTSAPTSYSVQAAGKVFVPVAVKRTSNRIGVANWPADDGFTGKIRGVRVYGRAFAKSELPELLRDGSGPSYGLLDLCSPSPPPPPPRPAPRPPPSPTAPTVPPPPAPPVSIEFALDSHQTENVVNPELFGHDLEFTRHDLFEGLSAELVANRKFGLRSLQSPRQGDIVERWTAIGSPRLDAPYWTNVSGLVSGDVGNSIHCSTSSGTRCGVYQNQYDDGFNSLMSAGSAIPLKQDSTYKVRLVTRNEGKISAALSTPDGNLIWQTEVPSSTNGWANFEAQFVANVTTLNATLTIVGEGGQEWWLGSVSLTPVVNTWKGMRNDTIAALQKINFRGLMRYPGGCFAPFYRWKIGLLPADQRPVIETPSSYCAAVSGGVNAYTDGMMENGIGIDDYLALCEAVGYVPAITVRLQYATPEEVQEARDWVEYCNGNTSTVWGKVRASRGHPEPYNVRYWYLGNEINQQSRYPNYPKSFEKDAPPTTVEYTKMLQRLVQPMLAASPDFPIQLLTVSGGTRDWDAAWANAVGDQVFATSFHDGYFNEPSGPDFSEGAVTTCTMRPRDQLIQAVYGLREELNSTNKTIAISLDEWGLGPPWRVTNFGVAHGMYAAGFLSAVTRSAQALNIRFTNYFEPVNEGAVQVGPFSATLTPVGQVMELYGQHQGRQRVMLPNVSFSGPLDTLVTVGEGSLLVTMANLNAVGWATCSVSITLLGWDVTSSDIATTTLKAQGFSRSSLFDIEPDSTSVKGNAVHVDVPPLSVVHFSIAGRVH